MLDVNGIRHVPGFHRRELRLQPGHKLKPLQPQPIPPLQHIHLRPSARGSIDPGRFKESVLQNQHIQRSNSGRNALHHHRQIRTDSHKHIIQPGSDILRRSRTV